MPENRVIEPPDIDRISRGDFRATADAIQLLWEVADQEARDRRSGVRQAIERLEPKALVASPAAAQHNYDTKGATILRFDGATSFDLTGLIARANNTIVIVWTLGTGTVTIKNNNAGSEERNRILTPAGGDLAVATNRLVLLAYLNTRWRASGLL